MDKFKIIKNASFPVESKDFSCLNTVKGECIENVSLEKCIQICEKDDDCDAGMHIKNDMKSVCFPYNTSVYPDSNPLNTLISKNKIPKLKGYDSAVFINSKKYAIPDNNSAKVYETDHVFLKNIETGLYLNHPTNYENVYSDIQFSKRKDPVIIIEDNQTKNRGLTYLIKNFDKITFLIPKTFFIPYVFQSNIQWVQLFGDSDVNREDFIQIRMSNKRLDNDVLYDQTFTMYYRNYLIGVNSKNKLGLYLTRNDKISYKFKFEAAWKGYYCENRKCKSIPFNKAKTNRSTATYKNSAVFRNKNCYDQC